MQFKDENIPYLNNRKMRGFTAYEMYLGVINHFANGKCFYTRNGGINQSKSQTYTANPKRWMFDRYSKYLKSLDYLKLMVSFIIDHKHNRLLIEHIDKHEAMKNHESRMKRLADINETVREEIASYTEGTGHAGNSETLVSGYHEGSISIDTLTAVDIALEGSMSSEMIMNDDQALGNLIKAYTPFMEKWCFVNSTEILEAHQAFHGIQRREASETDPFEKPFIHQELTPQEIKNLEDDIPF